MKEEALKKMLLSKNEEDIVLAVSYLCYNYDRQEIKTILCFTGRQIWPDLDIYCKEKNINIRIYICASPIIFDYNTSPSPVAKIYEI